MSKKERNEKHKVNEQKGLKLPSAHGKLYWTDGYWTDPRWTIDTPAKIAEQIRKDWESLEYAKTTEWYKEMMSKNMLEKH